MRILALTNLYPPHFIGGYELICRTVLKALRERGHSIQVLTSNHREPGVRSDDGAGEANSASSAASSELEAFPVERELWIHGFYGHPWVNIRRLRRIEEHNNRVFRSALARFKPDLVYVWNMGGLSKSMLFTLQDTGLPAVYYLSDHWIARGLRSDVWLNFWNHPQPRWKPGLLRWCWTRLGFRARWQRTAPAHPLEHLRFPRLYFCSRALRELTAQAGFAVEHGAVIYCPINRVFTQAEPRPSPARFSRLLYAGRVAPDKGILTGLRAFDLLRGKFAGHLHVCGGGPADYLEAARRLVREKSLPVTFGSASLEEMPRVYREHDGLLFTSEWPEPFALTPLEAMASGLPVIATTTGGSAELFRHRQNALVYTAGDARELAGRILEFAADRDLRKRCAVAGCEEVRRRCAEPVIVGQIEEYLEETLRTWKPAPLPPLPA